MQNMDKIVFDCIFTRPYAEEDYSLNDYINELIRRLAWRMLESQEEVCYNIMERNPPMLKENVIEHMRNILNDELGSLRNYIICRMLISYRISNIDLGDEGIEYLREEFTEEEWSNLNQAINKYVWEDYVRSLGEEEARKYFERIGRPEFLPEELRREDYAI